jgi:hypothetical protein
MKWPSLPFGATIGAQCQRAVSFVAGFVREHAPESSIRLSLLMFATIACIESHRIVSFAFANPTQHLTVGELVGLVAALLGTGCCGMALRTRSGDSAQAELEKIKAVAEQKLEAAADHRAASGVDQ